MTSPGSQLTSRDVSEMSNVGCQRICWSSTRAKQKWSSSLLRNSMTHLLTYISPLEILCVIHPVWEVRNLGVYLDQNLTMEAHIKYVEKSCNFQIRNIHRIRRFLSDSTFKTLVQVLVTSRMDYCNSLLIGMPKWDLHWMKKVQHSAARLVSKPNRSEDITSVLEDLHWFQIPDRIKFKVLPLTYKALHGEAPNYILDLLRSYNPTRSLRFENRPRRLITPKYEHERTGKRCCSVSAPQLWNDLPGHNRGAQSVSTFKKFLKHLFKVSFTHKCFIKFLMLFYVKRLELCMSAI